MRPPHQRPASRTEKECLQEMVLRQAEVAEAICLSYLELAISGLFVQRETLEFRACLGVLFLFLFASLSNENEASTREHKKLLL